MSKLEAFLGALILVFNVKCVISSVRYTKVKSSHPENGFKPIAFYPSFNFENNQLSQITSYKDPTQVSEKFWNVPAPYIPPNPNILEDTSFAIGVVLTVFVIGVISLGVIAGILSKPNSKRSLNEWHEEILNGIFKFAELNIDTDD
jgi:hypothetical protein